MRPQFLPQHQSLQPQQLIGGDAVVSENNLTSSSTGILQASVAINSHRQHVTVDTSTLQYDSYSQQRSQVEMYNILSHVSLLKCLLPTHRYMYTLLLLYKLSLRY